MMESIDEEFVHFRYGQGYFADTDAIREQWYPLLNGVAGITYLDHAGTTLRAKSFIESFLDERTDDVRLRVLQFFNASPMSLMWFLWQIRQQLLENLFEMTLGDFGMGTALIPTLV
ncbi:hypothetical protein N7499_003081 [Penicillium canescens]|uniref:uncharacterized protein n=1 Tax=Penicillium canescens TaxID=5083 RepID=UPI0026DF3ED5|nr:uncharacterized protein N7446_011954 [Penicillium canescens]KAJ6047120.1 hypothetical protein N7446_011954 [Penicillium canescens]KAJ6059872.1 hypothetical protein N7444_003511 [Penicillium canescens]KAJ6093750.1 hypothetical protein N7499_003081 [Penicillium canescens]